MDTITGPVLVSTLGVEESHETALGRPEGKKPVFRKIASESSNIGQATAVSHPKLTSYFDVIIFPVQGERSLASYLGGGGRHFLLMLIFETFAHKSTL
jgi:RNA-dependent RNA polymerase